MKERSTEQNLLSAMVGENVSSRRNLAVCQMLNPDRGSIVVLVPDCSVG